MNCPSHMTLFNTQMHSYRDLPLRYAEFATLYRYEKSGELNGLTRVRSLTQDDCHIFCTPEQIESEFTLALKLIRETLQRYGFDGLLCPAVPARRRPGKQVCPGRRAVDLAEDALRRALDANSVQYVEATGRGGVLRPQSRLPDARRAGPRVADFHHSSGLHSACAAWLLIYRRRQPPAHAGRPAPGRDGVHRAVFGHLD